MHSGDPQKDNVGFVTECLLILKKAAAQKGGVADFTRFVFPTGNFLNEEYRVRCLFDGATFLEDAVFRRSRFSSDVSFDGARFLKGTDFSGAEFLGEASFIQAKFASKADFDGARFKQDAHFLSSKFTGDFLFSRGTVEQKASFGGAAFDQGAHFDGADFEGNVDFLYVTFTGSANFRETKFAQEAKFLGSRFLGPTSFRETHFRQDDDLHPGPIFSLAQFERPQSVVFYKTYLGQALFCSCDVSRLTFSSVVWRRRKGSGKRMLFEEEVDLKDAPELKLGTYSSDELDYGLIAETYQQLKKNYDDRKDYWTAGDFHYGEMEMKRLHSLRRNSLARWWHRKFSMVAWYKRFSEYGESYVRPAVWLGVALLVFAFLFPWAGLHPGGNAAQSALSVAAGQVSPPASATELSYRNFSRFVDAYPGRKWVAHLAFFGHSLLTAVSVATFQKELRYEPSYPWGTALALLELLLTSTLVALFLLAVRRQFKR
jgi:uncharacterized protein YjbI with pentapeptide repeats